MSKTIHGNSFTNIDWQYSLNRSNLSYVKNRNKYTFSVYTNGNGKLYFYLNLSPNTSYNFKLKLKIYDKYATYAFDDGNINFLVAPTNCTHFDEIKGSKYNNLDYKDDTDIYSFNTLSKEKGEHKYTINFTTKNEGTCIFSFNFSEFINHQHIKFDLELGDPIYKLPYTTQSLSLINYSDNKSQPWIYQENHCSRNLSKENIYSRNENSFIEVQHKKLMCGYEHLYRKISYLDTTKTYKLSFKYKINLVDKQDHTVTDSDNPYLILLPDSYNFNNYGYFNGFYKSSELKINTTDYQTFVAEFTPTSSVIYPSFELGKLRDENYMDIKISEFKIEEEHKIQRQISIPNDQVWFTNYSEGFSYKNGISESGSYGVDITQYLNSKNWEKNYTILDLKPRTEYKISFIAKYDYKDGHAYFNVYGESAAKSKMLGEFNQNYGGDNITASEFGGIELNRNDSQQKTLKFTTKDEGKIYLFFSYANLDNHNTLKFSVQNLQITELTNDPSYGEVKLNENIKQTDNLIIYRNHIVNSLFRRTKQLY